MARWAFNDITVCFATEAFWSEELAAARVVAAREFMFHVERWLGHESHRRSVLDIVRRVSVTSRSMLQMGRDGGREMDRSILHSMQYALEGRRLVVLRNVKASPIMSLCGDHQAHWRFESGQIVTRRFPLTAVTILDSVPIRNPQSFRNAITRLLQQPIGRRLVQEILGKSLSKLDKAEAENRQTPTDAEILERVVTEWSRGELYYFENIIGGGASEDEELEKIAQAGRRSSVTSKTWIEVVLVDDMNQPIADALYRLKLTDGSVREGKMGPKGSVKVQGIDPGTCLITFPEIDANQWTQV